jgi:rod shape-determining protein MreD
MIMPRGQQLLLPASPLFIWLSLFVAMVINMLVTMVTDAPAPWLPDVLAICLVFWAVHQPRRVGVASAFVFGLLMDIHHTALLGQHALAYTLLGFGATMMHRRLLWFTVPQQAVQVLPLFMASHATIFMVRMLSDGQWPGWSVVLAPFVEALLWPVLSVILLAPQMRAPDPDADRPL